MSFSHPPILTIVARPDYRFAGGVAELLSNHADQVMANVAPDPERQKIVEHLFRALTDINAEGSAVRRPQTLAELTAVTGSDEQTLREIINTFRAEGVSFLPPMAKRRSSRTA
jgi:Novel STAND NTPase 1